MLSTTVLISVLTSGVVTLGLEWLAKPRLEARKEVLLELHRKRWQFEINLKTLLINISRWSDTPLPRELDIETRKRLNTVRRKDNQQIDLAVQEMYDNLADIALSHIGHLNRELITRYIYTVHLLHLSSRPTASKLETIHKLSGLMYDYQFVTWPHGVKHTRAAMQLKAELDKFASPHTR